MSIDPVQQGLAIKLRRLQSRYAKTLTQLVLLSEEMKKIRREYDDHGAYKILTSGTQINYVNQRGKSDEREKDAS
jgi:hypothetical protein